MKTTWVLLLFFALGGMSLYIQKKQDFSKRVTKLVTYHYGNNGTLYFQTAPIREPTESSVIISMCRGQYKIDEVTCEQMDTCQSYNIYDISRRNSSLYLTVRESDLYSVYILRCGRSTNIELNYTLHMLNGDSELSLGDYKQYMTTWILLCILFVVSVFVGGVCTLWFNKITIIQIVHVTALFFVVVGEVFSVCYFYMYNKYGLKYDNFDIMSRMCSTFSDIIIIGLVTITCNGYTIIYKHFSILHSKVLIIGILTYCVSVVLAYFVDGVFIFLGLVAAFFFITPTEIKSIVFNAKVVKYHILSNERVEHIGSLPQKIIVSKFLLGGVVAFWLLCFLNTFFLLFASTEITILCFVSQRILQILFLFYTIVVFFPFNGVYVPIEQNIQSVLAHNRFAVSKKTQYVVVDNFETLVETAQIVVFSFANSVNLNQLKLSPDGLMIMQNLSKDPVICMNN
ncbi:hypothetical protein EIN_198080 [Entamoeba invadens IP1]|uniref:Uncharacterized protein n=1 Tax=Entamoeba invadens IP1 TaxID=370355 RepID=A0A0A1TUR5_ENTIV|nr:hypothetical protein EIN_198080 [Entamoeba invadens IP1]ELP83855.1 hypothetical protein EIN_198080 [Entamoeba invadens IP1]|eukprot:XP_004183201.1 hypothetical protein EIN_198080 [Entamoeba invadens IP1]